MTVDPFIVLLGVPAEAGPRRLLGLTEGALTRVQVEVALRDRLEAVYHHPDHRSVDAEHVRHVLRAASDRLIHEITHPPPPARVSAAGQHPPHHAREGRRAAVGPRPATTRGNGHGAAPPLTAFDRSALATLVASGGWNKRSRARLVALAGAHRITAPGLIKVITGLSDYARRGGPRLGVAEITAGATSVGLRDAPALGPEVEPVLSRLAPELVEESLGARVKLSMLFAVVTLIACLFFVRVMLPKSLPAEPAPMAGPVPLVAAPAPPAGEQNTPAAAEPGQTRVASLSPFPSFLGNALPLEATEAADAAPAALEELDRIVRRLSLTAAPAESLFHQWRFAIDTIATGWVLVDESTRDDIGRKVQAALHEAADAPSVADRLLDALTPERGRFAKPADLWRGAWKAGMLGAISADAGLPAAVLERARLMLATATDADELSGLDRVGAIAIWQRRAALPALVAALETDSEAYDDWEMWLATDRMLGGGERRQAALFDALAALLATDTDLPRRGPTLDVVGRIVTMLDFTGSDVVRRGTGDLFGRDDVTDRDLWVFTSLLAALDSVAWYDETLVLPDGAGQRFRNRIRHRVLEAWPDDALAAAESARVDGRGLAVAAGPAGRWTSLVEQAATAPPAIETAALMDRLVVAAQLNYVAALLAARRTEEAESEMDAVAALLAEIDVAPAGRPAGARRRADRASTLGADGDWAANYAEARRSAAEKVKWLRVLRTSAGSDLGPTDTEVFVREVYRGSPNDVRSLARAILVDRFTQGRNIAMEMLDQFPDGPRNEAVSETLQRYTGQALPLAGSAEWRADARLALTEHALSVLEPGPSSVDARAVDLRQICVQRAMLLDPSRAVQTTARSPQEAVVALADAWRNRCELVIARTPAPADLPGMERRRLTRRRLAEGPIQVHVAELLSVLDALVYVAVAEQPERRDEALTLLAESAGARRRATHVLEQAIETERAIGRLWRLRFSFDDGGTRS